MLVVLRCWWFFIIRRIRTKFLILKCKLLKNLAQIYFSNLLFPVLNPVIHNFFSKYTTFCLCRNHSFYLKCPCFFCPIHHLRLISKASRYSGQIHTLFFLRITHLSSLFSTGHIASVLSDEIFLLPFRLLVVWGQGLDVLWFQSALHIDWYIVGI